MNKYSDFLIIGGGIIGLSLAQLLGKTAQVTLLEKDYLGAHASNNNNGVVHGGVYWPNGSLQSKYCIRGNQLLSDFCKEHAIRFNNLGKIIAPRDNEEIPQLEELYESAVRNGASVKYIDYNEAKEIEPRIVQKEKYIWSDKTSVADDVAVIKTLQKICEKRKITIIEGCQYIEHHEDAGTYVIQTQNGQIRTKYVINAAGNFADTIAKEFGLLQDYQIIPFKSRHLVARDGASRFNTLVQSVPIAPYFGLQTTNTIYGDVKIGPSEIPSLTRDNFASGIPKLNDTFRLLPTYLHLLRSPQRKVWQDLVTEERKKSEAKYMVEAVSKLVNGVTDEDYKAWSAVGIHGRLVNTETNELVPDFQIELGKRSWHFCNPVTPAWTSALAIAEDWSEKILGSIS